MNDSTSTVTHIIQVVGANVTLNTGNTYNCDNLILRGTNAARVFLRSSTANAYTYFNLVTGGTCDVKFVNATDVDSSGGRSIWTYKGVLTREINWNQLSSDPRKHILKYNNRLLKN